MIDRGLAEKQSIVCQPDVCMAELAVLKVF